MKIGIVGAGWAGLAAAVAATLDGHQVTVYEASRTVGGRARALSVTLPDGKPALLDNGQHILIGAYRETLRLLQAVGVNPGDALMRMPLTLQFAQGGGIRFPRCPAPLDALLGIVFCKGWGLADKTALLQRAVHWRWTGFRCPADLSVANLCAGLTLRVMRDLVEPLCVSALNTPPGRASGQVFLRVMQDAVLGASGDSNLLLPRCDLSALFPDAAVRWLTQHGAQVQLGARVHTLAKESGGWSVLGTRHDRLILATAAPDAARILTDSVPLLDGATAQRILPWSGLAHALQHEPIATVYAWGPGVTLACPMLALRSGAGAGCAGGSAPAQFVFDRGQLGGPAGLLAFVVSASSGDRATLQSQVVAQARLQLGLDLLPVQTVVEKRATFACTPGLQRPPTQIAAGLLACGDYVDGPYPSTLEGAVRSGLAAIRSSDSAS